MILDQRAAQQLLAAPPDSLSAGERRARRMLQATREERRVSSVQLRAAGEGDAGPTVFGHAATFETWYEVEDWLGTYKERVARTAFDKTLAERADVRLLLNHDGLPLARTKSGTLELRTDNVGLYYESGLDQRDPDVQRVVPKMDRGDLSDSSFLFRTMLQEWNEDYTERTLVEVKLYDVSIVTFPANPSADAGLRGAQLLEALADADPREVLAQARSANLLGGAFPLAAAVRAARLISGLVTRQSSVDEEAPEDDAEVSDLQVLGKTLDAALTHVNMLLAEESEEQGAQGGEEQNAADPPARDTSATLTSEQARRQLELIQMARAAG